jgi:hypothetical protein
MRPLGLFAAPLALVVSGALGTVTGPAPAFTSPCLDGDLDGWCVPADCDDDSPFVHPGLPEDCDPLSGADADCDGAHGLEDCDCGGFDGDEDGDGAQCGGESPDCDDHDARRFPDNVEHCFNAVDDDCDGLVDTDDPGCATDADGDGFSAPTDCDDTDAGVNPAAAEDCTNGIDEDCDGAADAGDPDCDADGDGYALDVDCDDANAAAHPGATEVANGHDDDCNGAVDEVYGGQLVADGGEVTVTILGDLSGALANDIYLFSPGPPRLLGTAGMPAGPLGLGTYDAGTELVLGIVTHDGPGDELRRFVMGPGCRNSDGNEHAHVTDLGGATARVAFEGLFGGDPSFDDAGVDVTGVRIIGPTGGVPERCNGIDDDCEDGVDNDPLGAGAGCGSGACTGTTVCVGGTLLCAVPDADGDGTPDCSDGCPGDPGKADPGACGCGGADADPDRDGVVDCLDGCPLDPAKAHPGTCGCGLSDADSDADGASDCHDGCPSDAAKVAAGRCGCGMADLDSDGDGTPDCLDHGQDLALVAIGAPRTMRLSARRPVQTKRATVWLQNRGPRTEVIPDPPTLGALVQLTVESPDGCTALVVLRPPRRFPLTVKSRRKLGVSFDVSFACADDALTTAKSGPSRQDARYRALVDRSVLDGLPDTHPADDTCPRGAPPPPGVDPNPDGSIRDRGCGARKAGTDVLTRVVVQ